MTEAARTPSLYWGMTLASLLAAALFALGLVLDDRLVEGVANWLKPLKFALSFILYFGTLALIADHMSPRWKYSRAIRWMGWVISAMFLFEMGYIAYQAGLGEMSHFNESTPFHAIMYGLMGVGAVILILAFVVFAIVVARDRAAHPKALRWAIVLGLVLSFALTLVIAGYIGGNGGRYVGVPPPNAPVIPLLGWSGAVGDLRPAHFLALHAMQVLPLLALVLGAMGLRQGPALGVTIVAGAGYTVLTIAVFMQALAGEPLITLL